MISRCRKSGGIKFSLVGRNNGVAWPSLLGLGKLRRQNCPVMTKSLPSRLLGRTDLHIPNLCFGTMLFGEGSTPKESFALMDVCLEHGLNFFDSAEMYPVPQRAETSGHSEELLGQWMKQRGLPRDSIIVSTKICGPSGEMVWIRGGPYKVDACNIKEAIDGSLTRLGTDYIDLIQIHWPDRYVPMFGDVDYDPVMNYSDTVPFEEQLEALSEAVRAGKVRHVGLSNETPYGVMRCLAAAEADRRYPRVASVQNAYNLMCRTFDAGLAEVCHQEGVSLLAYSPLAMGQLTGKYLDANGGPPAARLNRYKGRYAEAESRYGFRPNVVSAVKDYCAIAAAHGLSSTELALRFVLGHPLVASAVIGSTSADQLRELIAAAEKPRLEAAIMEEVNAVHQLYPNPTP